MACPCIGIIHVPGTNSVLPKSGDRGQGIHKGASVVALKPATGGLRPFAVTVSARIHQHDVVACAKKQLGLSRNSYTIVGDAMKCKHPRAIGICSVDFPAVKLAAI